ncbi:MAG: UDP-2,3-diacylglucosamine diphosphatase LpxI [Rhodobacteraceae bacterium]|nr:UDP-2,3-diacylglucosamine diphosphatase LpxI [Paracoccaceae bacterium]
MLALIAGQGALPNIIAQVALHNSGQMPVICVPEGSTVVIDGAFDPVPFRLETLGSLIADLRNRGVDQLCMIGAVARPSFDPALLDAATAPLVPRLQTALMAGDDGALRVLIALFEEAGISTIGADQIAPQLLARAGVPTLAKPGPDVADYAKRAALILADMGAQDSGQACIIGPNGFSLREDEAGTDALLARLALPQGCVLFKAPKPSQDRRADLPVIGATTASAAAKAGLKGLAVQAGGVMIPDISVLTAQLDRAGLFLWVYEAVG